MKNIINFKAIEDAEVLSSPYPFFGIENSLNTEYQKSIIADFPKLSSGGSFPLDDIEIKDSLQALVAEIKSDSFRHILAKKFEIDLSDKPLVITARGHSRQRDGQNHTDSKTKLITVLIYLNDNWTPPNGRLRILNSDDINDYKLEFSSSFGQLIAFKVTEHCWHGYLPYEGKRQSLQINYLVDEKHNQYHHYRHKISATFKKLFKSRA